MIFIIMTVCLKQEQLSISVHFLTRMVAVGPTCEIVVTVYVKNKYKRLLVPKGFTQRDWPRLKS